MVDVILSFTQRDVNNARSTWRGIQKKHLTFVLSSSSSIFFSFRPFIRKDVLIINLPVNNIHRFVRGRQ